MILCVINNGFQYELEKLCRIYLPFEKIEIVNERKQGEITAVAELVDGEEITLLASLSLDGKYAEYFERLPKDTPD